MSRYVSNSSPPFIFYDLLQNQNPLDVLVSFLTVTTQPIIIFIIIIIILLWEYFTPALADGFPLEFEWQQIFSTLQDTAVVWMVSTRPLISKSSSLFINSLVIKLCAEITTGITVTLVFRWFFSSLARSRYLCLVWLSFSFKLWSTGTGKYTNRQQVFFLVVWLRLGDPFVSQNPREFCASPSNSLMSHTGHSLAGASYPSAEMQLLYSTPAADLAIHIG